MLPSCEQMTHTPNWRETGLLPVGLLVGPSAETCRETIIDPWGTEGSIVRLCSNIPNHTVCLLLMMPAFFKCLLWIQHFCKIQKSRNSSSLRLQQRTLDSRLDPCPHGRIRQQWPWKLHPTLLNCWTNSSESLSALRSRSIIKAQKENFYKEMIFLANWQTRLKTTSWPHRRDWMLGIQERLNVDNILCRQGWCTIVGWLVLRTKPCFLE